MPHSFSLNNTYCLSNQHSNHPSRCLSVRLSLCILYFQLLLLNVVHFVTNTCNQEPAANTTSISPQLFFFLPPKQPLQYMKFFVLYPFSTTKFVIMSLFQAYPYFFIFHTHFSFFIFMHHQYTMISIYLCNKMLAIVLMCCILLFLFAYDEKYEQKGRQRRSF